jgi:diacylglycerol O-acyltransferase
VSVRAPHEREAFGNRISAMIVPIPTDVAQPRARLLRAHELLAGAKANHAALPASLLTDATSFIPPALAALAARTTIDLLGRTRPPLNLVISNVPGPREPLYCAGSKLEKMFPVSVVVDGVGLNMTVMSYRDHLDFGIVTDKGQIPDAWPFIAYLHEALEELETVLHGRGPTVKRRPAARTAHAARA